MDTQIAKILIEMWIIALVMSSNVDTDKDSNKNKDKVIQLAHIADKNNHTGKAAKLDVVKQNYNNNRVTDKKTTEHLPSDIHKTVDKTVKTKEKAGTLIQSKTNLVNLKCYRKNWRNNFKPIMVGLICVIRYVSFIHS